MCAGPKRGFGAQRGLVFCFAVSFAVFVVLTGIVTFGMSAPCVSSVVSLWATGAGNTLVSVFTGATVAHLEQYAIGLAGNHCFLSLRRIALKGGFSERQRQKGGRDKTEIREIL